MQENNNVGLSDKFDILSEDELYNIKKATLILRAINHPLRKQMLQLIKTNKVISVTEIYCTLRIEQSVASQHLSILRKSGVVSTLRKGKQIFYSVDFKRLEDICRFSNDLFNDDMAPAV